MKLIGFFIFFIAFTGFSQREKPKNYGRFDERLIHFGFMLGANSSSFSVYQKPDAYAQYGLKSLRIKSSAGGQVGIVSTLKLGTPVVRLRLIPTLSFQERVLSYQFEDPDNLEQDDFNEERINSTNLDFPLMFQFRTLRVNNFAAYALIGAQYSSDLQSQEKASQDFSDPFIKIKQHDFQGQIGGGVEFFAPYFKFGMEIKYSHGFINSFVPENTFIARPIQSTYNRVWWFSIIFEG
ncbi:MAG: porin family protein [Crocinitomicaceae bacterium]|nr:porin family protein [Crocinitomicaceae bacterium]MDG1777089.1 porin family protein [Crocinitomicaceae bacterium]